MYHRDVRVKQWNKSSGIKKVLKQNESLTPYSATSMTCCWLESSWHPCSWSHLMPATFPKRTAGNQIWGLWMWLLLETSRRFLRDVILSSYGQFVNFPECLGNVVLSSSSGPYRFSRHSYRCSRRSCMVESCCGYQWISLSCRWCRWLLIWPWIVASI